MKKHSGRKNGDIDIAGGISRKDTSGIIGEYNDSEPIQFCSHCLEFNVYNVLGPRQNYKERDADEWVQCSHPRKGCGRIYRVHGVKVESDISDIVEKTDEHDNPSIIGLENKKFRKTDHQLEKERILREADSYNDKDMRNARRHGLTVEDYTDYSLPENQNIKPDNTRRGGSKLDPRLRDVKDFEIADD